MILRRLICYFKHHQSYCLILYPLYSKLETQHFFMLKQRQELRLKHLSAGSWGCCNTHERTSHLLYKAYERFDNTGTKTPHKSYKKSPLEGDTVNEAIFPSLTLFITRYTESEGYWWQRLVARCSFILLVFLWSFHTPYFHPFTQRMAISNCYYRL